MHFSPDEAGIFYNLSRALNILTLKFTAFSSRGGEWTKNLVITDNLSASVDSVSRTSLALFSFSLPLLQ
jgi:hypothetical protein